MKSLRITTLAATMLFALSAVAMAAGKDPSSIPQAGKQPKSLMAATGKNAMKHKFVGGGSFSNHKVRPAGHSLMGPSSKANTKGGGENRTK
jgi:hypothetical protein